MYSKSMYTLYILCIKAFLESRTIHSLFIYLPLLASSKYTLKEKMNKVLSDKVLTTCPLLTHRERKDKRDRNTTKENTKSP